MQPLQSEYILIIYFLKNTELTELLLFEPTIPEVPVQKWQEKNDPEEHLRFHCFIFSCKASSLGWQSHPQLLLCSEERQLSTLHVGM